jgi:signal transduction histidine kinase
LGLYRVKEIVKIHSGKISVFSEGEGKGTTFKIEIPVYHKSKSGLIKKLSNHI